MIKRFFDPKAENGTKESFGDVLKIMYGCAQCMYAAYVIYVRII